MRALRQAALAIAIPVGSVIVIVVVSRLAVGQVRFELDGDPRVAVGGTLLIGVLAFLASYFGGDDPAAQHAEPTFAHVDARTAVLVARMLPLRARRRTLNVVPWDRADWALVIWGLSIIPIGAGVGSVIRLLTPLGETGAIMGSVGAWLVTTVILWRPVLRGFSFRGALERAARRLGGQPGFDPRRRVVWFDRHWLGDLTAFDLQTSAHSGVITLVAHVYPVIVVLDPVPVHVVLDARRAKRCRPPRLEVFLAAYVPGEGEHAGASVAYARHWLASHGFELIVSEAGLRARATAPRLETLSRRPATVTEVEQAVHALVSLAASLGAEPVGPIP